MVRIARPIDSISNSFLNECFLFPKFERVVGNFMNVFFKWTEPHVLVTLCIVILLLLPMIFLVRSNDSYLKISRLYNVSRLSILTFLHRIIYLYIIFVPLSIIIHQSPPCTHQHVTQNFYSIYNFPSTQYGSFCFTMLFFSFIVECSKPSLILIFPFILVFYSVFSIFIGNLSVGQEIFTLSLCYILHFYAQRVPFWFLHIENIILCLALIIFFVLSYKNFQENKESFGKIVLGLFLWCLDFFLLGSYQLTRQGFVAVGRPIDLRWETDTKSGTYFSILSSEEEMTFTKNLLKDFITSIVSILIYVIGLTVRCSIVGGFRNASTGLM